MGHARGIVYSLITRAEELLDYMLPIQAPDAAPRAIHMARPITRPNGTRTTSSSTTARPAAALQHVLRPMEAAAARRKRLVPAADQAWQGASPLQRRLAVATATTLRRPPHPLRRTGAAQHHLSPMRASSAKRHNAGGERARARRKAAWCRCRKASLLAPPAWFLAK